MVKEISAVSISVFTPLALGLTASASLFAKEPSFGSEWQQGIFWILSPLKQYLPLPPGELHAPIYIIKVPMDYHAVGYLDLRVVVIDLVVLFALIVVVPLVTTRSRPDVRQFGLVVGLLGVLFGIVLCIYNVAVWPWPVSEVWMRFLPLGVTILFVTLALAWRCGASRKRRCSR